ncbi:SH3 domain-containing protein [Fennellomyces sp. T-0311]|nr:SH3 domain-containing protein [Fennellomyces sp. T-0311]
MSERDVVLANYMLASIQKDLGFLKDNQYLSAQTYSEICALLPSNLSTTTAPANDFKKPPLPTRKSAGGVAPGLPPVPAAREMPKLPARRSTTDHQHIPAPTPRPQPSPRPSPRLKSAVNVMPLPAATPAPMPAPQPVAEPSPPPPAYSTTTSLATAEAVYDYQGDDPKTDLSFRRGDVIQVTEYVNNDWWRGELHGKSGIFPQNHVKKIT